MDTRAIAAEYRLSHWAKVIGERQESGLSVRAFCKSTGLHESAYYYWQRKLREAALDHMAELKSSIPQVDQVVPGFTEIRLVKPSECKTPTAMVSEGQIQIEIGELRISADGGYPSEKLAALLREWTRVC